MTLKSHFSLLRANPNMLCFLLWRKFLTKNLRTYKILTRLIVGCKKQGFLSAKFCGNTIYFFFTISRNIKEPWFTYFSERKNFFLYFHSCLDSASFSLWRRRWSPCWTPRSAWTPLSSMWQTTSAGRSLTLRAS